MYQLRSILRFQDGDYISNMVNSPCKPISEFPNNTLENFIQFCCFVFTYSSVNILRNQQELTGMNTGTLFQLGDPSLYFVS